MKKYTKEEIVDLFLITPCRRTSDTQSPLTTGLDSYDKYDFHDKLYQFVYDNCKTSFVEDSNIEIIDEDDCFKYNHYYENMVLRFLVYKFIYKISEPSHAMNMINIKNHIKSLCDKLGIHILNPIGVEIMANEVYSYFTPHFLASRDDYKGNYYNKQFAKNYFENKITECYDILITKLKALHGSTYDLSDMTHYYNRDDNNKFIEHDLSNRILIEVVYNCAKFNNEKLNNEEEFRLRFLNFDLTMSIESGMLERYCDDADVLICKLKELNKF